MRSSRIFVGERIIVVVVRMMMMSDTGASLMDARVKTLCCFANETRAMHVTETKAFMFRPKIRIRLIARLSQRQ